MPGIKRIASRVSRTIAPVPTFIQDYPATRLKPGYARLADPQQTRLAFVILPKAIAVRWNAFAMLRSGIALLLLLAQLLIPASQVHSQAPVPGAQDSLLAVYPPAIENFPTVTVGFEMYDTAGNFVDGLDASKITVLEDDRPVPAQALAVVQPGLQLAVAVNAGPSLGMLVGKQTFLEKVITPLQAWAETQATAVKAGSKDDFSLSTNTGLEANRLKQPVEWLATLKSYKPELEKLQPNLVSLTQALDQATDPAASSRVRRTILYITPALPRAAAANLANLVNRARQVGVRVHVWMVSPTPTPEADSAATLRVLAEQTGGQFSVITAANNPPDLESLLAPQRNLYEITYLSTARESGSHRVAVQVDWKGKKYTSREAPYTLTLQPPNPIFLSPPTQVQRAAGINAGNGSPTPEAVLLSILVEFPDGIIRPLKASRLYVDGVLAAENNWAAFDRFTWTPSNQAATRRHTLRVEVEDSLGLKNSSMEIPVDVISDAPARVTVFGTLSSYGLVAVGAMLLGAGAIGYVILTGRQPLKGRLGVGKKKRLVSASAALAPPPAPAERPHLSLPRLPEPAAWLHKQTPGKKGRAQAALVRLDENGGTLTGSQLPLSLRETTFGSDPRQVDYFIDAACVDKKHATLYHRKKDEYILVDGGSTAGTWVNFEPVSSQGVQLAHGDLVHLGRTAFRFEEKVPTRKRQLLVVKEEGK